MMRVCHVSRALLVPLLKHRYLVVHILRCNEAAGVLERRPVHLSACLTLTYHCYLSKTATRVEEYGNE